MNPNQPISFPAPPRGIADNPDYAVDFTKLGVEDLFLGFNSQQIDRFGVTYSISDINSSHIPYNATLSVQEAIAELSAVHSRLVIVDTIDEMIALPIVLDAVALVTDVHRGGIFKYDNNAVAVNNGGTILKGWKRQFSGSLNVKWFGAKGDGVTDDSPAFQAAVDVAFNTLIANISHDKRARYGGSIHAPGGAYRIKSRITNSLDTTNVDRFIEIVGESVTTTRILVDNPQGFIGFGVAGYGMLASVRKMTIQAAHKALSGVSSPEIEAAITVINGIAGVRRDPMGYFKELKIEGMTAWKTKAEVPYADRDYFKDGIYLKQIGASRIKDVTVSTFVPATTAEQPLSVVGDNGIRLINCYAPIVSNINVWGYDTCVLHDSANDPGAEGGSFVEMALLGRKGLLITSPSTIGEPYAKMHDIHANCLEYGIKVKNRQNVFLDTALCYHEPLDGYGHYDDIIFDNVTNGTINDVNFRFDGNTDRNNILIRGDSTIIGGDSSEIFITKFSSKTKGVGLRIKSADATGTQSVRNIDFSGDFFVSPHIATGAWEPVVIEGAFPKALRPLSIKSGVVAPETKVFGNIGSTYTNTNGTVGAIQYIKTEDNSKTGWVATA